jgi:hypothetical protein
MGKDGTVQTPTMIFRVGGVEMDRFLELDPNEIIAQVATADRSGSYRLPRHHVYLFPMPNGREVLCNMTRITFPDGSVPVGIRSADLTFAEMEGRDQAREYARFLKDKVPGFQDSYLIDTGAQVGIRQSRSLVARRRAQPRFLLGRLSPIRQAISRSVTWRTIPTTFHSKPSFPCLVRICWLRDDACRRSMKLWPQRESPRNASEWATRRARPPR